VNAQPDGRTAPVEGDRRRWWRRTSRTTRVVALITAGLLAFAIDADDLWHRLFAPPQAELSQIGDPDWYLITIEGAVTGQSASVLGAMIENRGERSATITSASRTVGGERRPVLQMVTIGPGVNDGDGTRGSVFTVDPGQTVTVFVPMGAPEPSYSDGGSVELVTSDGRADPFTVTFPPTDTANESSFDPGGPQGCEALPVEAQSFCAALTGTAKDAMTGETMVYLWCGGKVTDGVDESQRPEACRDEV
jgi:hypothetical protein